MIDALSALQDRTFAPAIKLNISVYPPERRPAAPQPVGYPDRRSFVGVASARPDGRPYGLISGYVSRDDLFWLPAAEDPVREYNVRRQPGGPW
jgi:hypothetical protein